MDTPAQPSVAAEAIVAEVMKKAAVIWVAIPPHQPRAAWTLWHADAAYVLHGPGEQQLPGLMEASRCEVIVRSNDNHAQLASWGAGVRMLDPTSEEWSEAAALLLPKRLNLTDTPTAIERWRAECHITALTPLTATSS